MKVQPKALSTPASPQTFLYLAPIKGVTEAGFRNIFHNHFGGCNAAIAPFINPQRSSNFKEKHLSDMLPENNSSLPIIPQLLHTNCDDFLALATRLHDLGYQEINWNLGCPAPMVVKKKRGSGLLPYPDEIVSFLERVLPRLKVALSIKTRLGYENREELLTLIPHLNAFPIKEIIIHARLGKQVYKGSVDLEGFSLCQDISSHPLVFNGDIIDPATFTELTSRFPKVQRWMLGRGLLSDPKLAQTLRGQNLSPEAYRKTLKSFHREIYNYYEDRLSGPSHLLGKMKQLWFYLSDCFPEKKKLRKKIRKSRTKAQYEKIIDELFEGTSL